MSVSAIGANSGIYQSALQATAASRKTDVQQLGLALQSSKPSAAQHQPQAAGAAGSDGDGDGSSIHVTA